MTKEEKEQKRQAQIQMLAVNAGITPEHLELLQQGFKEHDFTVSVPLPVTKPKRREKQPADAKKKAAENAKANAGQTNDSAAPSDDSVMDADRKTAVKEYYAQLFECLEDSLPELGNELSAPVSPEFAQRLTSDPSLAKQFKEMNEQILQLMRNLLTAVGFTRAPRNFSHNHPVILLMETDSKFIAEKATEILQDPELVNDVVELFCYLFAPLLETGANAYCRNRGKQMDDLASEDWQHIFDKVVSVVNETLLGAVMHGQQFPALVMDARAIPAQEDFGNKRNRDAINFYEKWNHVSTQVGLMLSTEDFLDAPALDSDPFFHALRNSFCEQLNDTDAAIFHMREDGYKVKEIAAALHFKNHSTVSKHLKNIREQWSAFVMENEPA